MTFRHFLKYLVGITVGVVGLIGIIAWFSVSIREHTAFGLSTALLFGLLCIGLFALGQHAVKSPNKQAFIQLVMGSVFGKMLFALAVLALYRELTRPKDAWFVGIFLVQYAIYTAFEIWFMTRLART
ncbi:MAG: hypothetical protein NZM43_08405 [Saprospiraceae bacterium]|nr:hypothetical protein [Saprospiraceae bacterium]MDW8484331.1 hypothetical protein [Saprospiraceae bacterium]